RFSAVAQILAEKGAVMHPYLNYVYVTMVREERERQAEHQRLVTLARRLRRQHRRIKTPHASIGVLRRRRTPALQPRQPEIAPEHPELRPGRCCMGAVRVPVAVVGPVSRPRPCASGPCGCRTGHPRYATWAYSCINPLTKSRRRR